MTAICGGGTSSQRPGVEDVVTVGAYAISALLAEVPIGWAARLAGYIGIVSLDVPSFCSTDPPTLPTITAADIGALLSPFANPLDFLTARQKMQDLVEIFIWNKLCQCDSGAAPTIPSPPAEPVGSPQLNPPYLPTQTAIPCLTVEQTTHATSSSGGTYVMFIGSGAQGSATGALPLPAGVTRLEVDWDVVGIAGQAYQIDYEGYTSGGAFTDALTSTSWIGSHSEHKIHTIPAGVTQYKFGWAATGTGVPADFHARATFYCGGATPSTPAGAPCIVDPISQQLLETILRNVELLQRQLIPFAFITGATHAISGNGEISLSHPIVGIDLQVTSIPSSYGSIDGDPVTYFDLGFVSIAAGDAWSEQRVVGNDRVLWLPRAMSSATTVGYSLAPGVTASLVELEREP